jgi:hypothetical protein
VKAQYPNRRISRDSKKKREVKKDLLMNIQLGGGSSFFTFDLDGGWGLSFH